MFGNQYSSLDCTVQGGWHVQETAGGNMMLLRLRCAAGDEAKEGVAGVTVIEEADDNLDLDRSRAHQQEPGAYW